LLFRWFVGLNMDEAVWHVTVYTKNGLAVTLALDPEKARGLLRLAVERAAP
jgi:hypothetical protein